MPCVTAVYDACVLYPAPLRDLLMRLTLVGAVRARWTERIQDEWIRNVLQNRPDLTREQLERTRSLMEQAVPDCLVEVCDDLLEELVLPDPDDRHVLAAAIRGAASVIVTFNLRDFPSRCLQPYGVCARHPDESVSSLLDAFPADVCRAAKQQRTSLRNPPSAVDCYLACLKKQGLSKTVQALGRFRDLI